MNNALITHEQRALLLSNGCASLRDPDFDPVPVVKPVSYTHLTLPTTPYV